MNGRRIALGLMRAFAAIVMALGAGLVAALVITVVDLYLSGHGYRALGSMQIMEPAMPFSVADAMFLATMAATGVATWWMSGKLIT